MAQAVAEPNPDDVRSPRIAGAPGAGRVPEDDPSRPSDVETRSQRFVALVSVAGVGLLTAMAAGAGLQGFTHIPARCWVIAALVLAGELFPITVPRRDDVEEITTSTTFAFALVIGSGATGAIAALALSSVAADLLHRKPLWKVLFNLAQYSLAVGAAGGVYAALGGPSHLAVHTLAPMLAAAITFFLVNNVLTGTAVGLAQGVPVRGYIVGDLWFQAAIAAALLSLSPIVIVVADRSLWLVPLLAVPVAAVYWGATASLENTRLVTRLEDSLEHMTDLNRLKDDFVAVVSHELRTPLTSIQGYIKTLMQLSSELEEEQQRSFLQAADRQSERLRRLIEQLLVVSRIESHVEPLSVSLVSLGQLTRHVVDELEPRAHGHTFDLRFDPKLALVETDEAKLHQIVSNLVENALKYSPPDTRITVRGLERDGGVALSVHDEGPGIPPHAQDKIFDRFYQVDSSATRAVGGTGLGLYICRRMTDSIGGRLWLERSTDSGTVFCLWVPRVQPHASDAEEQETPQPERRIFLLSR
jgi:signal transduction histidine kinase